MNSFERLLIAYSLFSLSSNLVHFLLIVHFVTRVLNFIVKMKVSVVKGQVMNADALVA